MNKLFFMFGAIIGASLGWALPDGNLVVTGFCALVAGLSTLAAWLIFNYLARKIHPRS
jgi:uncharacterized membrane protein